MQQSISQAIVGMFETLLCSWRCPVIHKAKADFQKQFFELSCLHLGSILHLGVAQSPKSQMVPFEWYPTVDSEQSSHATDQRAWRTDIAHVL